MATSQDPLPGPEEVLGFWFGTGDLDDPEVLQERKRAWFVADGRADDEIRERFGPLLDAAQRGGLDTWAASARGALALVLVLDQFPRNVHRGSPEAFACDALALAACEAGIAAGQDARLHPMEAAFLYMPMQHAEDRAVQARSCALTEALATRAAPAIRDLVAETASHAREHREIVERFGRFPHRNAALGRESTAEERAYLDAGAKTFGQS